MRSFSGLANLRGRVALVVGGAGHIGRAACKVLTDLGADVAAADLHVDPAQEVALALKVDLHSEPETRGVVGSTVDALGRLDILVHCAAYTGQTAAAGWSVPFDEQTAEAFDLGHRVNVTSAFVLAQEARAHLGRNGTGSIILVASMYGVVAPDFRLYEGTSIVSPAGYSTSKAAMLQLMRHLSTLFAPDIRVNAISPGGVFRHQNPTFVQRYEASTPLGRMATEEDLIGAIGFLSSDLSAYVTGANLVVDGGRTVW